jgi:DNA-binding response OmpR family regulator
MKKILVIDDDTSTNESISTYLKEIGYEVFSASNGLEGLDIIKKMKPNLIITDIRMPKLNGLELCYVLRGLDYNIPVIFISSFESEDYKNGEFNVYAFISKPINIFQLNEYINDAFIGNQNLGNICLN